MSVLLLVIGLVLFIGLVVVHEWGHFIVARRNGVDVEEFGIFFPPAIYKKKTKSGWDFTINALPLGGFVRLRGEHDSDTEPGTFGAASLWVKSKIMAAGVVMNLLTALVMLTILALIGMPKLVDNQYTVKKDGHLVSSRVLLSYVEPGSPAEKAGLKPLDEIVALRLPGHSPVDITGADKSRTVTKQFAGQTVDVMYVRNGQQQIGKAKLLDEKTVKASQKTDNPKGYLGILPREYRVERYTWSAPIVAVGFSAQITALTFQGLGHAVAGLGSIIAGAATGNTHARQNGQESASSQVSGPVGIYFILKSGSQLGYRYMLLIIAIISLTLAIMNILPIPALDGGRLWFTLASRGLGKPMTAKTEEIINASGFVFLIMLIILITIVDVHRFL
jgi:regulator of sigma E protease